MKFNSLLAPLMGLAFAANASAGSLEKSVAPVQPAPAEDPLGVVVTVGYDTDYVFRGIQFAENLVTAVIDGNFALNDMLTLNLGAWYGTSGDDSFTFGGGSYHELDLYGALLADLGPVTLGLKYTYYLYEGDAGDAIDDINEVGVLLFSTLGPVDVMAGAYYDETADGFYFETGVSKTFAITDRIGIKPEALVSYATDYYGVDGFNHVKLAVSFPIKLTSTATLTPYVAGNLPIDALDDLGEEERVYGGVALSVSF